MSLATIPPFRWLVIPYAPVNDPSLWEKSIVTQQRGDLEVGVSVLDDRTSRHVFGIPMARRAIQPVFVQIKNRSQQGYRLQFVSIDPNYFSPLEAAAANHYSSGKRLLGYGLFWIILPLIIWLLPIKLLAVRWANDKMDEFFQDRAFRMHPIPAGAEQSGFVYTNLTEGNRIVVIKLQGLQGPEEFEFSIPVHGFDADHLRREFDELHAGDQIEEVDLVGLTKHLKSSPAATTNRDQSRHGDPVNLVVVGDFATVLQSFGARWDETEAITLSSCWKTAKAFLTGKEYRYSPVSALYLFGRSQDFALQRIRNSINERLHLRLWLTPMRYQKQPVWIGQVSRDIGVRFTYKTWNLTTHRIDPEVDEARDYVIEDLMNCDRAAMVGYVDGVGECNRAQPRHNLTGDPYYTDGKRGVIFLSESRTMPKLISLK